MAVSLDNLMICIKSNITPDMYGDLEKYIKKLETERDYVKKLESDRDCYREAMIGLTNQVIDKDYELENKKKALLDVGETLKVLTVEKELLLDIVTNRMMKV